jgi:hypothetical protein
MTVPITEGVFYQHLSQKRHHNDFAENGRILMSKLQELDIPKSARGRTHGFVIPNLDSPTQREMLKLLCVKKWTAKINFNARINTSGRYYVYIHIMLNAY